MQELKKTSQLQHQLPELLSRPVQRILEYKLLLKVLSKHRKKIFQFYLLSLYYYDCFVSFIIKVAGLPFAIKMLLK